MMCPRIEYIYANMIIFGMTFYVDMSLIDTLVHALSLSCVFVRVSGPLDPAFKKIEGVMAGELHMGWLRGVFSLLLVGPYLGCLLWVFASLCLGFVFGGFNIWVFFFCWGFVFV